MDIDTMHAYRDAIRDEQGKRALEYAALALQVHFDGGLIGESAEPGIEQGLEGHPACPLLVQMQESTEEQGSRGFSGWYNGPGRCCSHSHRRRHRFGNDIPPSSARQLAARRCLARARYARV